LPWPVYSTRFIRGLHGTSTYTYSPPAGTRAVVKSVTAVNVGTAACKVWAIVSGVGFLLWSSPGAATSIHIETFVVVYAGETLMLYAEPAEADMMASGYLFTDPPAAATKPSDPSRPEIEPWDPASWSPPAGAAADAA